MVGFGEAVRNVVGLAVCGGFETRQTIARLAAPLLGRQAVALTELAAGFQALACNRPEPFEPDDYAPPEFEGGQCPGVLYDMIGTLENTNCASGNVTTTPNFNFFRGVGPISRQVTSPGGGVTTTRFRSSTGALSNPYSVRDDCPNGQPGQNNRILGASGVRVDGQPDDCGNPPRVFPDPLPRFNPPPINITYENDQGITVNATANVTIDSLVRTGDRFNFPVTVEVDGVNISGELNIDGTFTFAPNFT